MGKQAEKKRPLSPGDYSKIGPVYVRKRLLLLLLVAGASAVLLAFGSPAGLFAPLGKEEVPAYAYNDPRLREVSGVVRVLDDQGRLRYEGEVDAGACTGLGRVYDPSGGLVYEGPLVDGVYAGEGARVYAGGVLIYEGAMAANRYDGQGRRTDPDTGLVSEGEFVAGVFSGEGKQYAADGSLLREGNFQAEKLNGEGREYSAGGVLLREGTFRDGRLDGNGAQYTADGVLEYEGEFADGVFHGQGALYDTEQQTLVYEGGFVRGEPVGPGKLYHPDGQLLYEGQTVAGRPKAEAYLGLSLEQVEAAFAEHWLLYSGEGIAAFVYPSFHLMFLTESPVPLENSAAQDAPAPSAAPDEAASGAGPAAQTAPGGEEKEMALAAQTAKTELVITEVLSWGEPLAGTREDAGLLSETGPAGWREWFSGFAAGQRPEGAAVNQTGPFVYEFLASSVAEPVPVERFLSDGPGVQYRTVLRDGAVWYQSAVRKEENP